MRFHIDSDTLATPRHEHNICTLCAQRETTALECGYDEILLIGYCRYLHFDQIIPEPRWSIGSAVRLGTVATRFVLGISTKWPVDLQDSDQGAGNVKASEMAALEKVGLVHSQSAEAEYTTLSGRPAKAKVLRYELTDEGKKFYREKNVVGLGPNKKALGDICFGQRTVDKVSKTEGPIKMGDKTTATIYYTYRIENLADWANNPDIQKVFPGIVTTINAAGKTTLNQNLTLTDQGWMAK